jgi:energy-converting hydrogenase B subunit D
MTALLVVLFVLVAISATVVVFTREPQRQAVTLSVFGVLLTVLFLSLQAPDVALSELGVGAAVVPLMVMLTIRKIRGGR